MIFGLKVHSFISYCSLLSRYSFILSIWRSLPLLLIMLDSSSSLSLVAMMEDRGLMVGLNLQFSTSFILFSQCRYSLCLRVSSLSLVFFSYTNVQLLIELSFKDLLTAELLRLLLQFLLELVASACFFLESWYNRQKTLYRLLLAPFVVPLLLLEMIRPESLMLDWPVLFLLFLILVFSIVFSLVFFSLEWWLRSLRFSLSSNLAQFLSILQLDSLCLWVLKVLSCKLLMLVAKVEMILGSMLYLKQNRLARVIGSSSGPTKMEALLPYLNSITISTCSASSLISSSLRCGDSSGSSERKCSSSSNFSYSCELWVECRSQALLFLLMGQFKQQLYYYAKSRNQIQQQSDMGGHYSDEQSGHSLTRSASPATFWARVSYYLIPRAALIYLRLTGQPRWKMAAPQISMRARLFFLIRLCFSSLLRFWLAFFFWKQTGVTSTSLSIFGGCSLRHFQRFNLQAALAHFSATRSGEAILKTFAFLAGFRATFLFGFTAPRPPQQSQTPLRRSGLGSTFSGTANPPLLTLLGLVMTRVGRPTFLLASSTPDFLSFLISHLLMDDSLGSLCWNWRACMRKCSLWGGQSSKSTEAKACLASSTTP